MPFRSRPFSTVDDLQSMQAAITAAWRSPRRPLVACTIGDVAWWFASGGPDADWSSRIRIWRDADAAVAWGWFSPPSGLEWFVLPGLEEADEHGLRRAILDWGIERAAAFAAPSANGTSVDPVALEVWAADGWREAELLLGLGFKPTGRTLTQYFQSLDRDPPEPVAAPGYTLRTLAGADEIPARVEVHRSAFAPSKMTVEKYEILVGLPGYRYDLDVLVEAPDGSFAAFAMCWLDREAALGYLEPVGTHQDHRRLGLAKAVTAFGLRRLREEGARDAMVYADTPNAASNALYRSVGFSPIAVHRRYRAPALQSAR